MRQKAEERTDERVLEACVVQLCIYESDILALTKLQVAENNSLRRICGVMQNDERKIKEL